ncbi:MAG: glycogen debranching protein GlgX [Thermodesulfobacteriota bacterium]|nr:glycogen debranching protein GlgX [Thermodesulfobacteriota bacterium]
MKPYQITIGNRYPTGATVGADGTNFCIFSRHASAVQLLLYEKPDSSSPFQVIELDPIENRNFFFWHVFVEGLTGQEKISYTWKVDGPENGDTGYKFDPSLELLDPWARGVTDVLWQRKYNRDPEQKKGAVSMRAMVLPENSYDWEGDKPLQQTCEKEIIYELHVGGFTRHPSAEVKHPGTFSGIIEKVPYLQDLGVTAVELLPVMAFDEQDLPDNARDLELQNYWGYATHSFFSPHAGYCIDPLSGCHRDEFRDMVKALHRAGICVILDVAFNHTAEGGKDGPTINFKGLMNRGFYHLENHDPKLYKNYSGCGNTVNCNHPLVARFIIEALEYWVKEFHVDGFRFDLASILARGEDGAPMYHAPVVWNIEFSDTLSHTRLIAEAWDAGGLYQVGGFPGFRWAEWNGRYRDLIREFIKGDPGKVPELATRLTGSSDLYQSSGRLPINSVNFITCHDGFTLYDLVSYNEKHNQANGEGNRDGDNHNHSRNYGAEGVTDDPAVNARRRKQVKNFMAVLMLSQGVPMILAGDELLRTQQGNNNCYCQDNELSWFDWSLLEKNQEMFLFTRGMIRLRKRHPCLMQRQFLTGSQSDVDTMQDITWHGVKLNRPQWKDSSSKVLACTLSRVEAREEDLHIMFNMSEDNLSMELPELKERTWHLAVDTNRSISLDIMEPAQQQAIRGKSIQVCSYSVVVCESR